MDRYFSGQGKILVAVRDGASVGGFDEVGDVSSLVIRAGNILNQKAVSGGQTPDFGWTPGDVPMFEMNVDNFSPDNLARSLYGLKTEVVADSIEDEVVVAVSGKSVPLAHVNLSSFTSLRNSDLSTTYVLDTDYEIDLPGGMLYFPDGSAITNAQSLRASYDTGTYHKISAGVIAPPYLWLRFNGLNTAEDNKPVIIDIYKARYSPVDIVSLIQDADFSTLLVGGRIFYDDTQPDNTTDGRWFRIRGA